MDIFAKNLRKFREGLGWSQAELARKSGVPQPQVSDYEAEKKKPTIGSFLALCQALRKTPNEMAGWPANQVFPVEIMELAEKLASLPDSDPRKIVINQILGLSDPPTENKDVDETNERE